MSSTVTMASSMLPSIGEEEDVFESASVRILPATPAQVVPVAAAASSGGVKTYISVYNGEGRLFHATSRFSPFKFEWQLMHLFSTGPLVEFPSC